MNRSYALFAMTVVLTTALTARTHAETNPTTAEIVERCVTKFGALGFGPDDPEIEMNKTKTTKYKSQLNLTSWPKSRLQQTLTPLFANYGVTTTEYVAIAYVLAIQGVDTTANANRIAKFLKTDANITGEHDNALLCGISSLGVICDRYPSKQLIHTIMTFEGDDLTMGEMNGVRQFCFSRYPQSVLMMAANDQEVRKRLIEAFADSRIVPIDNLPGVEKLAARYTHNGNRQVAAIAGILRKEIKTLEANEAKELKDESDDD